MIIAKKRIISDFGAKEYDVFISYAEADEDLAIVLSQKLEGKVVTSSEVEPLGRTFKCCLHQVLFRRFNTGLVEFNLKYRNYSNSTGFVCVFHKHSCTFSNG